MQPLIIPVVCDKQIHHIPLLVPKTFKPSEYLKASLSDNIVGLTLCNLINHSEIIYPISVIDNCPTVFESIDWKNSVCTPIYDNQPSLPTYYYPPRPVSAPNLSVNIPAINSWREGHGRPSTACPGDKRSVIKNKSVPMVFSCVNFPQNRSKSCVCKSSYRKSENRSKSINLNRETIPNSYKPKVKTSLSQFKKREELYKYHNATPPVRAYQNDS